MACYLLAKNSPSRWLTGMIVGAFPETHVFGRLESKGVFLASGGDADDWPRLFVIVKVTDLNDDAPEIKPLIELGSDNLPDFRLKPQGPESPYFQQLLDNAYIEAPWAVVSQLVEAVNSGN